MTLIQKSCIKWVAETNEGKFTKDTPTRAEFTSAFIEHLYAEENCMALVVVLYYYDSRFNSATALAHSLSISRLGGDYDKNRIACVSDCYQGKAYYIAEDMEQLSRFSSSGRELSPFTYKWLEQAYEVYAYKMVVHTCKPSEVALARNRMNFVITGRGELLDDNMTLGRDTGRLH